MGGILSRMNWYRFSSPQRFFSLAGNLVPWLAALALLCMALGVYIGLALAPTDFQQGEAYRIIFVHVPAAWMSMVLFVVMAVWSGIGLGFQARLPFMIAQAVAPTGAMFTFLALLTGSLWGKPMWGTWWVWDARLTSELILLLLYIGVLALHAAIDDRRRRDRAAAVFALVAVVNIPIIYFSVNWWNTLHQGASVSFTAAPTMAGTMLMGMLVMVLGFWMYSIAISLSRVRCMILEHEVFPSSPRELAEVG